MKMNNDNLPNKLNLSHLPTPLQRISFRGAKFFIKRDDLTGTETTGNKIRKLDYLMYDVVKKKAKIVFTCGGDQSNHARATLYAARALGIDARLYLWGKDTKNPDGNLFIDKILKPEIKFLNKEQFMNVREIMKKDAEEIKDKNVYIIPEGGSSPIGIWGYIHSMSELYHLLDNRKINGILTAAGSGGTAAGLLIGSKLFGIPLKVFAVNVLYSKKQLEETVFNLVEQTCKIYKLKLEIKKSDLEILDGYSQEGYKDISDDKMTLIKDFAFETGILLDPTYTGKAFKAYYDNFLVNKKSSNTIFLHSGGLFGIFSKKEKYLS